MSKFKSGDEVRVRAKVNKFYQSKDEYEIRFLSKGRLGTFCSFVREDDLIPCNEKTYEDGLKEAWETAKKIVLNEKDGALPYSELIEIFDSDSPYFIFKKYTMAECVEKIKAWEYEKEIHLKDQVMHKDDNTKTGVVMAVDETRKSRRAFVWWDDKSASNEYTRNLYRK